MGVVSVVPAAVLACCLALAAPAAAETVACPGADVPVGSGNAQAARDTVACLVDRERASRALPRLTVEPRVAAAAQAHAQDMTDRRYFSHTAPPPAPATALDRLRAQGYDPAVHWEVLGAGQATPRAVVRRWMQSADHCAALLSAAGPEAPSQGPVHIGVGEVGRSTNARWVLIVALPVGGTDPGYPGYVPSCPAADVAPDSAPVRPFVARPQTGGAPAGPPAGSPGGSPSAGRDTGPAGASAAGLTVPAVAVPSGSVFSGDLVELTLEASPDAVLRVSLVNFRGERRGVGTARRIDGVAGSAPGTAVFALPRFRVVSALDVVVTDGRTTVSRRLVPGARLRAVRARWTAKGLRVTGRLLPGLRHRRVEVRIRRGGRTVRRFVRTTRGGRFSLTRRPPRGPGRISVQITAPGDGGLYRRAVLTLHGR